MTGGRIQQPPIEVPPLGETVLTVVIVVVVLAAALGPVAALRYLAVLERRKDGHHDNNRK